MDRNSYYDFIFINPCLQEGYTLCQEFAFAGLFIACMKSLNRNTFN